MKTMLTDSDLQKVIDKIDQMRMVLFYMWTHMAETPHWRVYNFF